MSLPCPTAAVQSDFEKKDSTDIVRQGAHRCVQSGLSNHLSITQVTQSIEYTNYHAEINVM